MEPPIWIWREALDELHAAERALAAARGEQYAERRTAHRCREVRLGGPNDEALAGHSLSGKSLEGYRLNEVHNPEWIRQIIRANSVHLAHRDEAFSGLHHYVLPFHDEMMEALAESIDTSLVNGTFRGVLSELVTRVTS